MLIFCPLVCVVVLEVLQTITDIQLDKHEIREIERVQNKKHDVEDTKKSEIVDEPIIISTIEENVEDEDKFVDEKSKHKSQENNHLISDVLRDEIQISMNEHRESENYISIPTVEEDKVSRDNIEIV